MAFVNLLVLTLFRLGGTVEQEEGHPEGAFGRLVRECGLGESAALSQGVRSFLASGLEEMEKLEYITREFTPGKTRRRALSIRLTRYPFDERELATRLGLYVRHADRYRELILDPGTED
jgi:hypothetical protein